MKNKKYALYIHHVLKQDLFYVGITANINRRFVNYRYEDTSLSDYLDKTIPFKQNKNIETVCTEPLEAKRRYLSEGYIPNYIKHDDIPYAE